MAALQGEAGGRQVGTPRGAVQGAGAAGGHINDGWSPQLGGGGKQGRKAPLREQSSGDPPHTEHQTVNETEYQTTNKTEDQTVNETEYHTMNKTENQTTDLAKPQISQKPAEAPVADGSDTDTDALSDYDTPRGGRLRRPGGPRASG